MALIQSFSGIRGIYPKEINGDIARRYAYCFYEFIKNEIGKEPIVVIGTDTRESSEMIKEAMFDVFLNIIDLGETPTPAVELGVRHYKADCGIIVTASHNEPNYNGFKFLDKDGAVLKQSKIAKIISRFSKLKNIEEEEFLDNYVYKETGPRIKKLVNKDIKADYFAFLMNILKPERIGLIKNSKLKVVIDPVGGTGNIAEEILKRLGVKVIGVNMKRQEFKRKVEPNYDSLNYLKDIVKKEKADFAAGFDLDADRVEIMLKDGSLVSGNVILALIVDELISEGKTVVINDATSDLIHYVADSNNAKVREVEVGETNVVEAMNKSKSPIGGEGSNGGVIIPPSKCRDGILTLLFILYIIKKNEMKLEDIVKELPVYHYKKEKVKIDKELKEDVMPTIEAYYKRKEIKKTGDEDGGLKVLSRDGFVWFRFSKTEDSLLRIIVDSKDKKKADEMLKEAIYVVKNVK